MALTQQVASRQLVDIGSRPNSLPQDTPGRAIQIAQRRFV